MGIIIWAIAQRGKESRHAGWLVKLISTLATEDGAFQLINWVEPCAHPAPAIGELIEIVVEHQPPAGSGTKQRGVASRQAGLAWQVAGAGQAANWQEGAWRLT